jgi:S1/P1 Nuclease
LITVREAGKLLFKLQGKNKMKFYLKPKILLMVVLLPMGFIYSWGEKGHEVINGKAVELLPKEMDSFKIWKNYLVQHASDADIRRKTDRTEAPRHYIDIDFYKEFLDGNMIENEDELVSKYGDSIVTKNGILPWATQQTLNNLTEAFKEKNRDKILIFAADLGHYVADGHQPMHTTINYNGQLTDQKGVHFRYEVTMVDKNIDTLEQVSDSTNIHYVENPLHYIFNYISGANSVNVVLLDGDKLAHNETGSTESDDYYKILWFRTRYVTEMQFKTAEEDLASLLYTAWVNAGKPVFTEIN